MSDTCVLCGDQSSDVRMAVIRWIPSMTPAGAGAFGAGPRCRDRRQCRMRVESIGDTWPVMEIGDIRHASREEAGL